MVLHPGMNIKPYLFTLIMDELTIHIVLVDKLGRWRAALEPK